MARLHGLFAAYKPPGLKWEHLRDTVELQLLRGEPPVALGPTRVLPVAFPEPIGAVPGPSSL